ncbi:MAG: MFS transporter, partial [Deltaproteobacteria bacterium]|nr:MFS transporter [Deltaproteobacteria bacterium]
EMCIRDSFITSRRLAVSGLIIMILSFLLLYLARTFTAVLLLMVMIGGTRELFRISLETFVFKSNEIETMPVSLGNYHGPRMLGLFAGMLLSALILNSVSFREFFLIISAGLVVPVILTLYLPDVQVSKSGANEYKRELIRPQVIVFMIFCFNFTSHWGAEYVNYGLFLKNNLLLSNSDSALYMSFEFLLIGITVPFFGRYYRSFRTEYSTPFALLLSGTGHIFMVNNNVWVSLLFRGVHGIGDGLLIIISYMIIAENFSKERIGGLNAAINFVMMAGMLLGSVIYGYLGENLGSGLSLVISGVVTIVSIPVIYLWFYLRRKEEGIN